MINRWQAGSCQLELAELSCLRCPPARRPAASTRGGAGEAARDDGIWHNQWRLRRRLPLRLGLLLLLLGKGRAWCRPCLPLLRLLGGRRLPWGGAVVAVDVAPPEGRQRRAVDNWDAVLRRQRLPLLSARGRPWLLPELLLLLLCVGRRLLGPGASRRLLELLLLLRWPGRCGVLGSAWRRSLWGLLPGRRVCKLLLLLRGRRWGRGPAAATGRHRLPLRLEHLLLEAVRLRLLLGLQRLSEAGALRRRQRPRLLRGRRRLLLLVGSCGRRHCCCRRGHRHAIIAAIVLPELCKPLLVCRVGTAGRRTGQHAWRQVRFPGWSSSSSSSGVAMHGSNPQQATGSKPQPVAASQQQPAPTLGLTGSFRPPQPSWQAPQRPSCRRQAPPPAAPAG